jgi:tetratricopeptide (TPR) repeat protein
MLNSNTAILGSEGGPSGSPSLPKRALAVVAVAALLFGGGALLSGFDAPEAIGGRAGSPKDKASLALSYVQTARAEADPTYYTKAEALLEGSLEAQPDGNFEAYVAMASLANGRHDFIGSVRWSRRAIATNPHNAASYGLLGDSLFELGRTKAADRAYQQMIDIRPDLASYVRASYSHQFRGNIAPALSAMQLALQSAGPAGESPAWIRHQLGDIHFGAGDLDEALRQNRLGTKLAPGYVPPTVGVAEVLIARGHLDRAVTILERAVERLPALEYIIKLGDLYAATGRPDEAETQYQRVADRLALYRANGVRPDVDFILFYADHDVRPRAALREVRAMYAQRPTAAVAEAFAWTLHVRGRDREALGYARSSLRGAAISGDAFYRAAVIAAEAGRPELARSRLKVALSQEWTIPVLARRAAHELAAELATSKG